MEALSNCTLQPSDAPVSPRIARKFIVREAIARS